MKRKIVFIAHILILVCFTICLMLNMVGIFGDSWLTVDDSTDIFPDHHKNYGVVRMCRVMQNIEHCRYRNDLFKFKSLTRHKAILLDIVLTLLVISESWCLLGIQCSIILLKCRKKKKHWMCGCLFAAVFSFLAASLNIATCVYTQIQISSLPGFEQGWTTKVLWASAALQIICCMSCVAMATMNPAGSKQPARTESPSSTLNYPLERYFYGSSKSNSMNRFNERWFNERYSTTASNGYASTGVTNDGYDARETVITM